MTKRKKLIIFSASAVLLAAAVAIFGGILFPERASALGFTSFTLAAVCLAFVCFELSRSTVLEISLVAVMTALSVCGRVLFYPIAFFKPVSAIVILCGLWLGPLAGLICGGLSAIVSGIFFGYGLWLPFQVLAWGLIGLFAGLLRRPMKKSRIILCLYGALSGVFFSAFMDIFTVFSFGSEFNFSMYSAALLSALPITAVYAVSNVIFLLALARPIGKKLDRVLSPEGK